jgi:hypothetical protein
MLHFSVVLEHCEAIGLAIAQSVIHDLHIPTERRLHRGERSPGAVPRQRSESEGSLITAWAATDASLAFVILATADDCPLRIVFSRSRSYPRPSQSGTAEVFRWSDSSGSPLPPLACMSLTHSRIPVLIDEEMRHDGRLLTRIVFLEGHPDLETRCG